MKKIIYNYPKSSFLSTEKDMSLIVNMILKNENLKKMLHYTSRDCLSKPNITEDESLDLFGKNIKLVPKLYVDGEVLNYKGEDFLQLVTSEEYKCHDSLQGGIIYQILPDRFCRVGDVKIREQLFYRDDWGGRIKKNTNNPVKINEEVALKWLSVGAQPTDTVKTLLTNAGVMKKYYETKSN